jgi:hypothetical protein
MELTLVESSLKGVGTGVFTLGSPCEVEFSLNEAFGLPLFCYWEAPKKIGLTMVSILAAIFSAGARITKKGGGLHTADSRNLIVK